MARSGAIVMDERTQETSKSDRIEEKPPRYLRWSTRDEVIRHDDWEGHCQYQELVLQPRSITARIKMSQAAGPVLASFADRSPIE
jgi:hypothetical protein